LTDIGYSTSEAIEGLIAAQIKIDVNMKMNKLEARWHARKCYPELFAEIRDHLGPSQTDSRERIMEVAIEKMRGISGTNLAARVTEASEAAILEELHKAIEEQMRGYMK
jgi:hypothetical protein